MDETRVSRYKEYRQSFIKEGSITTDGTTDLSATTATLPMDEVINAVQEEEGKASKDRKIRNKKAIKIVIEILVAVLLVAGLIVLGIFAWRK